MWLGSAMLSDNGFEKSVKIVQLIQRRKHLRYSAA